MLDQRLPEIPAGKAPLVFITHASRLVTVFFMLA
jgi:hypothetical protein